MYSAPEDSTTVPLCIDVGVILAQSATYTITTQQKSPPQADGQTQNVYLQIFLIELLNLLQMLILVQVPV